MTRKHRAWIYVQDVLTQTYELSYEVGCLLTATPIPKPIFFFLKLVAPELQHNSPITLFPLSSWYFIITHLEVIKLVFILAEEEECHMLLPKFFCVPRCLCFVSINCPLNWPWSREEILLEWNNLMRNNRLDSCFSPSSSDFDDGGEGLKNTIKQRLSDWIKSKLWSYAVHETLALNIKTFIS